MLFMQHHGLKSALLVHNIIYYGAHTLHYLTSKMKDMHAISLVQTHALFRGTYLFQSLSYVT